MTLASRSDSLEVKPEKEGPMQEIGERDHATWRWHITNHGTQDSRLLLSAQLVNKNGDDIPLIQAEQLILSSNLVRQVRSYLQPISLAVGAVLGSLLVCITGLFRRVSHRAAAKERPAPIPPYAGPKQL